MVGGPQNAQGDFEGTDGRCSAGATFCQGVFGVGLVLCGVASVDRVLNKRV